MLAPEILQGKGYTSSIDSWGLGACWIQILGTKNGVWSRFQSLTSIGTDLEQRRIDEVIEMLHLDSDQPAFNTDSASKHKLSEAEIKDWNLLKNLLRRMLCIDPERRINVS